MGNEWMLKTLAQAVVHVGFTDSFVVKFVPDLDSNVNMSRRESQEAPLISHQMLLGSIYWGFTLKSAAMG